MSDELSYNKKIQYSVDFLRRQRRKYTILAARLQRNWCDVTAWTQKCTENLTPKLTIKELLTIFQVGNENKNILGRKNSRSNSMIYYLILFWPQETGKHNPNWLMKKKRCWLTDQSRSRHKNRNSVTDFKLKAFTTGNWLL